MIIAIDELSLRAFWLQDKFLSRVVYDDKIQVVVEMYVGCEGKMDSDAVCL